MILLFFIIIMDFKHLILNFIIKQLTIIKFIKTKIKLLPILYV